MLAFFVGEKNMKEPLITMLEIYKPLEQGRDWMNYKIVNPADLTFHHIKEKRNGGARVLNNGAILIRRSHDYLNYLDYCYHRYYKDLNELFHILNMTMAPPTEDYYEEVDYILRKIK